MSAAVDHSIKRHLPYVFTSNMLTGEGWRWCVGMKSLKTQKRGEDLISHDEEAERSGCFQGKIAKTYCGSILMFNIFKFKIDTR